MKYGIVNHQRNEIESIKKLLSQLDNTESIWNAHTCDEANEKMSISSANIILIDIGLVADAVRRCIPNIQKQFPNTVIIVTAGTANYSSALVFEAMGAGVLDVVELPKSNSDFPDVLHKIESLTRLVKEAVSGNKPKLSVTGESALVAIGASTGGPKALAAIVSKLPEGLPASVVIIQHLDEKFSSDLINWLSTYTQLPIKIARQGDSPERGNIYIASKNDHLVLLENRTFAYTPEPRDNPYRPSVDSFFLSAARFRSGRNIAVLLTGMGRDGALGLKALKDSGWLTIAQNEATCVVYGMPKAAIELKAASRVLALSEIADAIHFYVTGKGTL